MTILRRLKLTLSCLLAVLLVGGAALPSPARWQCGHCAGAVAAPAALPCLMGSPRGGDRMPPMACCRPTRPATGQSPSAGQALSCPACLPTLTRLAALPAAGVTEAQTHLRQSLGSLHTAFPPPAALASSVPITLSLRQRPPPTACLRRPALEHTPGLRAPPAA